jgi:hypothetical protein
MLEVDFSNEGRSQGMQLLSMYVTVEPLVSKISTLDSMAKYVEVML